MRRGQTRYGHVFSKGKAATARVKEGSWRGHRSKPVDSFEEALKAMAGPERLANVLAKGASGIRFVCAQCGHTGSMEKALALKTFGGHATPHQIRARLRCSKCGGRRCDVGG